MNFLRFKMTVRNARKNGVLTFAKLFGLSISFAVILFAVGYVYYETSFDRHVPDRERIYRCLMQGKLNEEIADYAVTSPEQAAAMVNNIPEISESVRMLARGRADLKYENENVADGQLFYADPAFFSFFGIPVKATQENPLASENDLVIAKSIAERQFGSVGNALGKVVELRGENCIITGVFDDPPRNFHLRVQLIQSLQKSNPDEIGWGSQSYYTYFKTSSPDMDVSELNFKISKLVYANSDDRIDAAKAQNMDDLKYSPDFYLFYTCEPLTNIHFSSHKFDPAVTSDKLYVYGAVILAILVLLISSVNFVNLTVATVSTRLKEVGIRKTVGAYKADIASQFLYETFAFFLVSFVLAGVIYLAAGRPLVHYLGFDVVLSGDLVLKIMVAVFMILLVFILTSNLLHIFLVSNKKVLTLFRNERVDRRNSWGSQGLLVMQFILSGLIILSTVIVQKQIHFMISKDRGYDPENVMMLDLGRMNGQSRKSFIEKLKTYEAVGSVATSDVYFGEDFSMTAAFFEREDEENYFHPSVFPVDDEFLNTFRFKMKEGRFFDRDRKSDFGAVILNESAVREYGGKGTLIGKNVIFGGKTCQVIGIVKDFNFRSLRHQVEPLLITQAENCGGVYVKIRNVDVSGVIGIVQKLWREFNIDAPLDYAFHDEVVVRHYIKDQQAKKLLLLLSAISIAIACVGLYAVSFFSIVSRTKEIGIRKVNGARVAEVMAMLNKDFVKWVAIAFVIATPVAWYAMDIWLENFAYKTELSWWIFALAGLLALGIALLTVSWQSWKAATRNPVEALRYE
ncbi:MAG: ABC transporter permease [Prolixibacteraceae bacterium]